MKYDQFECLNYNDRLKILFEKVFGKEKKDAVPVDKIKKKKKK